MSKKSRGQDALIVVDSFSTTHKAFAECQEQGRELALTARCALMS